MRKEEIHDMSLEERSEKVRGLLSEIPPSLVKWGIAILTTIFIALIAAVCLIPYPESGGESIAFHLIH